MIVDVVFFSLLPPNFYRKVRDGQGTYQMV